MFPVGRLATNATNPDQTRYKYRQSFALLTSVNDLLVPVPLVLSDGFSSPPSVSRGILELRRDMALDNGYHFAAQALPTPTDAPYDSPFVDVSTQSSTRGSSSPSSDNFLVPFPLDKNSYFPKLQETTDDGNIDKTPAQESRRFTPNNLGISLVAQIHSLRKELGSKDSMMENLEEHLHKSRAENEQLSKDLKTQKAEVTSVKKQMQSLEREMLQALEETAKERDNALETVADTRKRLEDSTRKVRAQEEDANKAHALWEKDRQTWDDKRRKLESRVHTVEERLKTMVAEMLIVKSTDQRSVGMGDDVDEGMKDSCFGNGNDPPGISATSRLSNRGLDESYESNRISNLRSSRMSGLHSLGGSQMSGLSLAEELEFEQGENSAEEEDNDKNAQPGDTYTLARRSSVDEEVRRDFHADADEEPLGDETSGQHSIGIINDYIDFPGKKLGNHYTDTGTQLSPPRSPSLPQQEPGVSEKCIEQTEPTANQSRKRINIPQVFVEQTLATPQPKTLSMISIGSQTIRQPEDPASTAKAANSTSGSAPFGATEMKSACTQTVQDPIPVSKSANSHLSPSSMDVPVIAIHPPASIPSSSRNGVMLPPRTKNAACQVIIELPRYMKSKSMQTEERRVDKRPVRIPPRLSSSDHPTQAPPQLAERRKQAGTVSGPEPSAHRLPSQARAKTEGKQPSVRTPRTKNAYSGHNDDGPLNHKQRHGPRRPIRSGSIFAGFDVSSDDDSKNAEDHFSDDEFLNAAPVRKTLSKVQNSWKLVPHLKDSVLERLESASEEAENEKRASVPKPAAAKAKPQSHTTSKTFHIRQMESYRTALSNAKQPDIRRKALVSNGVRKHGQRSSIPSESNVLINEATIAPPFPVPARLSSRKVPLSASDEAASPSPHTKTFFSARRGQSNDKSHNKRKILRKVQSAAAVTQPAVPLRLASLQSLSASSTVPPSPKSTAPRRSQFISPYSSNVAGLSSHSTLPQSRAGETSVEAPREQTSVVDTIAQTMVGEWMWKYVRKRTSFGITENPHAEFELGRNGDNGNGSGVRHKRWVWLAPFERAVIWSSKQPTSGPALLGKGGRKRMSSFEHVHGTR